MLDSEFYKFKPLDSNGVSYDFNQLRNKVVIIVNVASLCGFTPQYNDLEYLYEKYMEKGLVILGFPCNQFGNQEPLNDQDIVKYCRKGFGVTFPIMRKVEVNGEFESPLYTYLKSEQRGALGFKGVRWNFEKFVIDKNGKIVKRFLSTVAPKEFESLIIKLLEE